jgi:hypothetical protein
MSAAPSLTATAPAVSQVLAEIGGGQGLSLSEAARLFPASRGKGRLHPATIWRWICQGVELSDGSRLRLEAVRLGGRFLTSKEALLRFAAAQNAAGGAASAPAVRSAAQRKRGNADAARQLDRLGL